MTFVLSPPGQHELPLLTPGYLMFFVNIGPDSERERKWCISTIRRSWVCINRCFHLSPQKSTLPNPHISTRRSTALQTCIISSEHLILSFVPSTTSHHFLTADDFGTFLQTKLEQSVVSFHLNTHRTSNQPHPLLKLPSSPSVPSLRRKYPNFSSPAILQHVPRPNPLAPSPSNLSHSYQHSHTLSTHLSSQASSPLHSSRLGLPHCSKNLH